MPSKLPSYPRTVTHACHSPFVEASPSTLTGSTCAGCAPVPARPWRSAPATFSHPWRSGSSALPRAYPSRTRGSAWATNSVLPAPLVRSVIVRRSAAMVFASAHCCPDEGRNSAPET
jgi:hypothetical protein